MKKSILFLFVFLVIFPVSYSLAKGKAVPIRKQPLSSAQAEALKNRDLALNKLKASTDSKVEVRFAENGTPKLLKGQLTGKTQGDKLQFALDFVNEYKDLFMLKEPTSELKLKNVKTDKAGNTHIRFEQTYQSLPVWASQIIVHFHKDGYIKSVNGVYEPTPQIDVNPTIDKETALKIAKDNLKAEKFRKEPAAELVIFPWENQTYLAWQISLIPKISENWKYFVDAKIGTILLKYNDVKKDGSVTAYGIDVLDNFVPLNAYAYLGEVILVDVTKPMFVPPADNLNGVIITFDMYGDTSLENAIVVFDPNADTVFDDNSSLAAGVSAHYNLGLVYDYFYNTFGWDSWDGSGSNIVAYVHPGGNEDGLPNNAFWNGYAMVFGDGDGFIFSPLAGALDVCAHELAHAITDATADLVYLGEWGALNEHISDFWGAMLDRNDWLMGEDVYTPFIFGDALRDMANPHNSSNPQPAHMSEYVYFPNDGIYDYGGVHGNSGIPNKASYLLATTITRDTTEELYYQALVNYLLPRSRFVDLRYALLSSADDIYSLAPNYSHILSSINNSFDAVGIIDLYDLGTDTLAYDDGEGYWYFYVGPIDIYNLKWAVRFTPHAPCTLLAVTAQFYTTGTNAYLHIWEDLAGVPGNELLNLNINRTEIYPNWQTINLSSYKFSFDEDFYVGLSSVTFDSFLIFDYLQEPTNYTVYADTFSDGNWFLITPDDINNSIGDPLVRALVKYQSICTAISGDANGDGLIRLSDIVTLINFLFKSGPTPDPFCSGDPNNDGLIRLSDIVYLINFLFKTGAPPIKSGVCCL